MNWFKKVWMHTTMKRKPTLKIKMDEDLKLRLSLQAKSAGMELDQYVERLLLAAAPVPAAPKPAVPSTTDVIDRAFDDMDKDEALGLNVRGVLPMPPRMEAPKPAPSIHESVKVTTAMPSGLHACIHLNPIPSPQYQATETQGVCTAQGGKVCHWASHSARQCPVFRPRRVFAPQAP